MIFRRIGLVALAAILSVFTLCDRAGAAEPFRIEDIRLEGLSRISPGTVFNYLPLKVGDTVDSARTADAIRALYKTGFFKDVRMERQGNTLVIDVVERPSIASIEFTGNKELKTETLIEGLSQVGFAEGRIFNRSVFDRVEQELKRNYFAIGKYGVKIDSSVTPLERNRVAVRFDISEGKAARIKQINIVGNTVFDDGELLDLFSLSSTKLFSFLTKADQYSKIKLAGDLETLRSFYLDRGYINFNIDSTQVSITPDKRDVYITVNITEGDQFVVSEVRLAGDLIVDKEELFDLVSIRAGSVFSRKEITETTAALSERLGDDGYAFANINAVPEIDEDTKQVALTFFLDPGKRVYVRRINFEGNTKTRDEVLRREMRQLEGAWMSTGAVERSKARLERLGFFEEVNVETPAVAGTADQVDVNYTVVEAPAGNLLLGAGFSQTQGLIAQISVTQRNFLGTGNEFSVRFSNSKVNRNIGFSWLNPYWTDDGVSRGFDFYLRSIDAAKANLAKYDLNELGGGVNFGVPISEFNRLELGFNAQSTDIKLNEDPSDELLDFVDKFGSNFTTTWMTTGLSTDTRDSVLLPTTGALTRFDGELAVPIGELAYYKVELKHQRFFPLFREFVLMLKGDVGYGNGYAGTGTLPLIENFYAGGILSVRGWKANTLGPRDSKNDPIGGNLKLVGNAEVIMPIPFLKDVKQLRITSFFDIGNVYGANENVDLGELRYSVGVSGFWVSPLGPLSVSFAVPLNDRSGDETQPFQFTFGTSF